MIKEKDLFQNKDLKTGGFYELAIQVCPSTNNNPIELYTNHIWSLDNVLGPFDNDFNIIDVDRENIEHNGLLKLDNALIPFKTYNIREDEPIETGFNWFDICFYTAAIEHIFGSNFKTWTEKPICPPQIESFFDSVIEELFDLYQFELAMIDFEISGQYYLDYFKEPIENPFYPKFYVDNKNSHLIADENRTRIKFI